MCIIYWNDFLGATNKMQESWIKPIATHDPYVLQISKPDDTTSKHMSTSSLI